MGFRCGIIGLPNVGKSTLFRALTANPVEASNYPFCTIEPNVGIVSVPDARLKALAKIVKPENVLPAVVEFVDIAGLVEGASKGEGLGNQFLANIRETQAIAHVVRCFEDEQVIHVAGEVNPQHDIEVIHTELALADLEVVSKARDKASKKSKSSDKEAQQLLACLEKVEAHLEDGFAVRTLSLTDDELLLIKHLQLLTLKPMLYVANVAEDGFESNDKLASVQVLADSEGAELVPICASIEAELLDLSDDEKVDFMNELGIEEPGLDRFIHGGYRLLGLETYFTAGPKEVRAWTIPSGATAPQAAGVIHSDFERGFIRAEVIAFDDYMKCGGESGAKEAACRWRQEGKDYIVKDGDIILYRFAV